MRAELCGPFLSGRYRSSRYRACPGKDKSVPPRPAVAVLAALLWGGCAAAAPPPAAASVHPELWSIVAPPSPDAATEAFVQQLLDHMSLEDKVGQMIQADIASISPAELRTYKLGSILAGGNAAPGDNVRTAPQAWLDLTDAFYRASLEATSAAHPP